MNAQSIPEFSRIHLVKFSALMLFVLFVANARAQLPECNSNVPYFAVDLSDNPDSTYITPEITRVGQCCGGASNENYVSFYLTLHPEVAMVEIGIEGGADPSGSGFYNIISGGDLLNPGTCGPNIAGGTSTCIVGSGPHKITYHKPGSNKVKYQVRQIPKPIFPANDSVRMGCSKKLSVYGLDSIEITSVNSSTGNTALGAYNSLLTCTNCPDPVFEPGLSTPAWIDYQICGDPLADACGNYTSCDTVRIYTFSSLSLNTTPVPATFCAGGSGITLTATGSGGLPAYSFIWRNSSNQIIGTGSTYLASSQGSYTAELNDQLSGDGCEGVFKTVSVIETNPPVVNAGFDDTVCATKPIAFLNASVQYGSGGIWSGGNGVFQPSNTSLIASYTPTPAEISAGSLTLTLTSTGAGGGCLNDADQVTIYYSDSVLVDPSFDPMICNGSTTALYSNASGGVAPYTYQWSTGSSAQDITAAAGTYSVMVRDQRACVGSAVISVNQPSALNMGITTTPTSGELMCDGSAQVSVTGGAPPYTYLWSNGSTSDTAQSLCFGIVSVTVLDSMGCMLIHSAVVNKPSCSGFEVSVSFNDIQCYGDSTAAISTSVSGGTTPYSYLWSTLAGDTNSAVSGLPAGTYSVQITDDNGCLTMATVGITQPPILTNTMSHTDATTIGGINGTATAYPQGGTPDYAYFWSTIPAQTSQTAVGLAAGVYQVEINDFENCTTLDSVQINQPPCNNFIIAVNTDNVSCHGASNGMASLLIAHGTPPYDILWSNGEEDFMAISGLAPGSYGVTVTDATFCTTFQTFTITEPLELSLGLSGYNVNCWGGNDGTIDLTVLGGTFPFTYTWYSGSTVYGNQEDLINLTPSTYSVSVSDARGCSATASIGISQPNKLSATGVATDALCNGDSNGAILTTPSGGIKPYTHTWTGPGSFTSSLKDISGLPAGLYEYQFSDANGCLLNPKLQKYINQPDTVKIQAAETYCPAPGEPVALVEVVLTSGGSPGSYSYSFDDGLNYGIPGDDTASLPVDNTYFLWAKDINGCTSVSPYEVNIDPLVIIDSVLFDPCIPEGADSIEAVVFPAGGDGGAYSVSVNAGSTYLDSGTYNVFLPVNQDHHMVVKDVRNCMSETMTISIPDELMATASQSLQVSCLGESDGAMELTVSGGETPYAFAWSGPGGYGAGSQSISSLTAGVYSVTVTDSNGCTDVSSDTVTTVADVTNPSIQCPSNIVVSNDSGSCGAVVTYNSPLASDNCLTVNTAMTAGLVSGSFFPEGMTDLTFVASDSVGNTATCSFSVSVNDVETPQFTSCPTDITVFNDSATCGAEVSWALPTATDNCGISTMSANADPGDVFDLGTSTVTYTITDSSGNQSTCSFDVTILDNEAPLVTTCPSNLVQNTDSGLCGAIVTWSEPMAIDNCSGFTITSSHGSGDYFETGFDTVVYTFTDSVGNFSTCSFEVEVMDVELPDIQCIANIETCDTVVVYDFPVATDNCGVNSVVQVAGLGSGATFPVGITQEVFEVTDVHGNTSSCQISITVFPNPQIVLDVTDVACNGEPSGEIDASIISGTEPYQYNWSNGETSQDINMLVPGTYSLTVTDANACLAVSEAVVSEPTSLTVTAVLHDLLCFDDFTGFIDISVDGGVSPYSFSWNTGDISEDIHDMAAGTYLLTVTDSRLCELALEFSIKQPDEISISATSVPATCAANNGVLDITPTGGTPPFTYLWSNGALSQDLTDVGPGLYTLTLTDTNACTVVYVDSVDFVSDISISSTIRDVKCHGDSTGSIDLSLASTSGGFSFIWSNGATTEDLYSLIAGKYSVTVSDSALCSASGSFIIHQSEVLTAAMFSPVYELDYNVSGFGAADGSIDLTVDGGTLPYEFLWSTGATSEDLEGLLVGRYSVLITDFQGCTTHDVIELTGPDDIELPEGISPNNDGRNDLFVVKGLDAYPDNELIVYNRWGNVVYRKKGYQNEWDGRNVNGSPLPDATYFVILQIESKDKTYNGFIDLRR